jgi:hypothetical protein
MSTTHEVHMNAAEKASRRDQEVDAAHEEMKRFEQQDELPSDLSKWPSGRAMYVTIDSGSEEPYGQGLTGKLGPADLEHHTDGSVTIAGKQVDNPQDYKGTPIPNPLPAAQESG